MIKKNIVITGSQGLLGQVFSNHLSKRNNVIKIDKLKLKKNISNFYQCDITKEIEVNKVFEKILIKNDIDILINNASHNPKSNGTKFKFSNYRFDSWKKNLEVDLYGSFLTSKYACKFFEKKNKGLIINISSIYGQLGPDQDIYNSKRKKYFGFKRLEYSVAKAGLLGFTKALASFYKNTDIRIISLILGGVETSNMNLNFKKNYSKKTIIGRLAKKNEYNGILDFLISEDNSYITGSSIVADGGATTII